MLEQNYNVGILHKNLLPRERKKTFKQIGEYKYKYLVATDLVSRGIDIQNVDCVISYDLPEDDI
jgi:ATP-dependent RNA helicase CshB